MGAGDGSGRTHLKALDMKGGWKISSVLSGQKQYSDSTQRDAHRDAHGKNHNCSPSK